MTLKQRIQEINNQYDKEFWWKADMYSRPIHFETQYITDKYKKHIEINESVESIHDLLKLIRKYPIDPTITYTIQMEKLYAIEEPLKALNSMIGMKELKRAVLDQILYYIQDLHKVHENSNEYLHTVLSGSPGTGKTEVAKILGSIFSRLSILSKTGFKKATRDDFIAGYLGQTSLKTRELIERTRGSVLFIDEAYSLGHSDKRDSYAKEAIDTLNEALSDYRKDWMVIIAGYEDELKRCFFSYNSGLHSRFPWWYKLEDYNGEELCQIFQKLAKEQGWTTQTLEKEWFEKHRKTYFTQNGRDMETLLTKSKIAYGRCMFGKRIEKPPILTQAIVEKGFQMYCKNRDVKESVNLPMYM